MERFKSGGSKDIEMMLQNVLFVACFRAKITIK